MEDHRARRNQLFALEAVNLEDGHSFPIERCETRANGVQPPQRAAVVVFVVAYEQTLRKPVHPLWLQQKRPNRHDFRLGEFFGSFWLFSVHTAHSSPSEMRRTWT
jgi:hypothetical protein